MNDVPGFATSRLGGSRTKRYSYARRRSGICIDIDTAMRLGYKHPMGPLGCQTWLDWTLGGISSTVCPNHWRPNSPHPCLKIGQGGSLGKDWDQIYHWNDGQKVDREDLGGDDTGFSGLRVLVTGGAGGIGTENVVCMLSGQKS